MGPVIKPAWTIKCTGMAQVHKLNKNNTKSKQS